MEQIFHAVGQTIASRANDCHFCKKNVNVWRRWRGWQIQTFQCEEEGGNLKLAKICRNCKNDFKITWKCNDSQTSIRESITHRNMYPQHGMTVKTLTLGNQ